MLKRSEVVLPIPGTSNPHHLKEDVADAGITLTDADFKSSTSRGAPHHSKRKPADSRERLPGWRINGQEALRKDNARGKRLARRLDTGMMYVNHTTSSTPGLPFGGIKNSGYGRELSSMGIQEFVNKKLVRVTSIDPQPGVPLSV